MMICCFQICASLSATTRVATSGLLPAAAGVMICTGFEGYVWAAAGEDARTATNKSPGPHGCAVTAFLHCRLCRDYAQEPPCRKALLRLALLGICLMRSSPPR